MLAGLARSHSGLRAIHLTGLELGCFAKGGGRWVGPGFAGAWRGRRLCFGLGVGDQVVSSLHVAPGDKFPTRYTTNSIVRLNPDESAVRMVSASDHLVDLSSDGTRMIISVTKEGKQT